MAGIKRANTSGITKTGSGGGAGGFANGSTMTSGNGGSGLVIVRYTKTSVGG